MSRRTRPEWAPWTWLPFLVAGLKVPSRSFSKSRAGYSCVLVASPSPLVLVAFCTWIVFIRDVSRVQHESVFYPCINICFSPHNEGD